MKKLWLVVLLILVSAGFVFAVTVDNKISANTVSFNTVNIADNRWPHIVTFNSVTRHIRIINLSKSVDCWADLKCANGDARNATLNVLIPAIGSTTPNTVELDFATNRIAFGITGTDADAARAEGIGGYPNLQVHYIITGDQGDF